MSTLYLDLETFSQVPIDQGTDAYTDASMPLIVTWAVDDGPVQHACPEGRQLPASFCEAFKNADRLVAHNAQFDRAVLKHAGLEAPVEKWHCTMNQAYAHGLPGSLGALCRIFKVDTAKRDGKRLIKLFCIPQGDGTRIELDARPKEAAEFIEYARTDTEALRQVHRALPTWNEALEQRIRVADTRINMRGIAVDMDLAASVSLLLTLADNKASARIYDLTLGWADGATDRNALLEWLRMRGVALTSLDASTVRETLATREDLDEDVREVLRLRMQYGQASVSKFRTVLDSSVDGRLRYTLQYAGAARTRRWSGRMFQPQNLPRPTRKADEIDRAIDNLSSGVHPVGDFIDWAADMVRGVLVPSHGRQFVVADLSNIEGRMLAWVAGEEWKLEAFRAYDRKEGPDIYVASYAQAFGVHVDQVTKDQRQIGKVMELALGYQGGVGAFSTMAAGYGLDLNDLAQKVLAAFNVEAVRRRYQNSYEFYLNTRGANDPLALDTFCGIRLLVDRWREAHPATVKLWSGLQQAFAEVAAGEPGTVAQVRNMSVDRVGSCVRLRLPSQRYLCYHRLQVHLRNGTLVCPTPQQLGGEVAQYSATARALSTLYGGKIVENVCQSLARDILAEALVDLDRPGAPAQVVMHVHDEVIVEAFPGAFGVEHLVMDLTRQRPWSEGLPLAAAGFTCKRYRKE